MRDLTLAWRRRSDVFTSVIFFVIVASLFPLGIGPEGKLLLAIGPGVVWVAALLASMLALSRLFAADYADGTLEQMLIGAAPLPVVVIAKVIAHWIAANLPLVLIAPLLGLQYGLPADVQFCRRCVISNQRPNSAIEFSHTKASRKQTIHFDEKEMRRVPADGGARVAFEH